MSTASGSEPPPSSTIVHYTYGCKFLGMCLFTQPCCYIRGSFYEKSRRASPKWTGEVREHWNQVLLPRAAEEINSTYYDDTCLGPHGSTGNSEMLQGTWIHDANKYLHVHGMEAYSGFSVFRTNNGKTTTVEIRVMDHEVRGLEKKSLRQLLVGDGRNLPAAADDESKDLVLTKTAPKKVSMEREGSADGAESASASTTVETQEEQSDA